MNNEESFPKERALLIGTAAFSLVYFEVIADQFGSKSGEILITEPIWFIKPFSDTEVYVYI